MSKKSVVLIRHHGHKPSDLMETVCFSETSVSTYKSTRRHDPEDQQRHLPRRDNLRSHHASSPASCFVQCNDDIQC
jgi:hypothetical protein